MIHQTVLRKIVLDIADHNNDAICEEPERQSGRSFPRAASGGTRRSSSGQTVTIREGGTGQTVIVQNRPGDSGDTAVIATDRAKRRVGLDIPQPNETSILASRLSYRRAMPLAARAEAAQRVPR
jgi:hypothetical protein